MKTNGWISLHRKIMESPIWGKPAEWSKIWIYLLLEVDHQTGEEFFMWEIIQRNCHVTKDQLRDCLEFMEKEKMITREKLPRGVKITVLNWADYQNRRKSMSNIVLEPSSTPSSKPSSTPSSKPSSETGQEVSNNDKLKDMENLKSLINLDDKAPIKNEATAPTHNTINNNNINNLNNKRVNTYIPEHEIFDYWNSKKTKINRSFEKIKPHISAALKLYSEEEIKQAIDNYVLIINNPEIDKYWWTHKYLLKDFLLKGLERFAPDNFKESDYFKRTYKSKAELDEERSLEILSKIYKEEEAKENDEKGNDNNIGDLKGSI